MNPYDFVPLDIEHPPERRRPVWHNALTSDKTHPGKLYSGYLYLYIRAETPIFIRHADSSVQDSDRPGEHIYNKDGDYIIPGTSIKGMLRTVVETLCQGCLTVINRDSPIPKSFPPCDNTMSLCISCRLFGMMQRQRQAEVFLGKVNIGDAIAFEHNPDYHAPIYTAVLDAPKPSHRAFYLDEQERFIAGRKFYFHNENLLTEKRLLPISGRDTYRNQHIQPLDKGTDFSARIDFTNLEADEFAALLFALLLKDDMVHKIGYGKPIGLGSVQLDITNLQLVDYANRYRDIRSGRGTSYYKGDPLYELLDNKMASIDPQIHVAWEHFETLPALNQLHRIWLWPPDTSVEYAYPSQRWFKEHSRARIRDTRNLYRGD
jgi:CRISPR/Cas system CSM-associated protein Csm3 (group 7 of RAMP superfamily)